MFWNSLYEQNPKLSLGFQFDQAFMLQNSENSQTSCTICYATEEIWLWTGGKCTLVQSGMGLMNMNETQKDTIELINILCI